MRISTPYGYNFWLLNIPAYLTVLAVSYPMLVELPPGPVRGVSLTLLALFGLLVTFCLNTAERPFLTQLYLVAQTAIVVALLMLAPIVATDIQTLFFILSAQAMLLLPLRQGLAWIFLFTGITILGGAFLFGWGRLLHLLSVIGGYTFFGAFGAALRDAIAARQETQRLFSELQKVNEQLHAYTKQAQQLAVAEERNRLAREMHDALGHRLTVAVVQLEGARRLIPLDPERAGSIVETMRVQLKEALAELRQTISTLRNPDQKETPPVPLQTAVSQLAHTFAQATGLRVHLQMPPQLPPLPDTHREALYRAAQESLTNVQRHANAADAWLQIGLHNGHVTLTTADNGQGYPAEMADGRFGLQGLAERAQALGGTLRLHSSAHGGAQLTFALPIVPKMAVPEIGD